MHADRVPPGDTADGAQPMGARGDERAPGRYRNREDDRARAAERVPAQPGVGASPVRMAMSLGEAEQLDAQLLAHRGSPVSIGLRELLWLRAVFLEQQRRTPVGDRRRFEQRADRILARLWAISTPIGPSETTITVGRNGKR